MKRGARPFQRLIFHPTADDINPADSTIFHVAWEKKALMPAPHISGKTD
jgi:hypothetical protein